MILFVSDMFKSCSKCKESLPLSKFSFKDKSKSKYSSICKPCHNSYVKNTWYKNNSISQKKASAIWKKNNKDKVVSTKYKISLEEARDLLEKTSCEICGVEEKLNIDHDHATGAVRGRLCVNCNAGLGHFRDSISLLKEAIKYMTRAAKVARKAHNLTEEGAEPSPATIILNGGMAERLKATDC